jgi:CelD/BcsL family acetyltransferase involved in cellulose biosynthesis
MFLSKFSFPQNSTGQKSMELTLSRELPVHSELRQQWDGLVNSMERPQVFYTWEWAQAVCKAYAGEMQPLFCMARREGVLVGIVALALSGDDDHRKASFLTSTTADYCDFISAPLDRLQLVRLTMNALAAMGVRKFEFANVPADSASIPAIASAIRARKLFSFSRPAYLCAQVNLQLPHARDNAVRSARRKAKRKEKALISSGQTSVVHGKQWSDIALSFPKYAGAHVSRFLAEGKLSNLIKKRRRDFLEELGQLLDQRGWLTLSTVTLNGEPIAWNYGMSFHGTWFWYQPAFDLNWSRFSPGTYLLNEIILAASQDSACHTIDLGLGEEDYKNKYSNSARQTHHISASDSIYEICRDVCRYHLAALLRKSSRLDSAFRNYVSRVRSIAAREAKLARHSLGRLRQIFFGNTEVVFFQPPKPAWGVNSGSEGRSCLQPITLESLALAAMKYETDGGTLAYLLRCAHRLHTGEAEGFALTDFAGVPIHFCWVAPFQGFWISELGRKLTEPEPDSALIFDCWTPVDLRGQGNYTRVLPLVAEAVLNSGKRPWIFSATGNASSIEGIQRAGFVARFSITHKKKFAFLQSWQEQQQIGEIGLHTAA